MRLVETVNQRKLIKYLFIFDFILLLVQMSSNNATLLGLPNELLDMIIRDLEYAYEVNCLSQTCRDLYEIANDHLWKCYVEKCSPYGLDRIVKSNNVLALSKLLEHGLRFDEYERTIGWATPIRWTLQDDLSEMAALLSAYSTDFIQDPQNQDKPYRRAAHRSNLSLLLRYALEREAHGVMKILVSCPVLDEDKSNIMSEAVQDNKLDIVRYLVHRGVKVKPKHLKDAALQGNLEMIKLFVQAGADLNDPDVQAIRYSPYRAGTRRNHDAIVQYLVEMGTKPSALSLEDFEKLSLYVLRPDYEIPNIVEKIDLERIMSDPRIRSEFTSSDFFLVLAGLNDQRLYEKARSMQKVPHDRWLFECLEMAASNGNLNFARYTLNEMIQGDQNVRDWRHEWSRLLGKAIELDNISMLEILLDLSPEAPIDHEKPWLNHSLLFISKRSKHMEVLLQRGLLADMKSATFERVFVDAFSDGNHALVWQLMEHGELGLHDNFDGPEPVGGTVFWIAARHSSLKTFQEFLSTQNVALDPAHPFHRSALTWAAVGYNVDVVGYFLGNGFDVNDLYVLRPTDLSCPVEPSKSLILHVVQLGGIMPEKAAETVEFLLDHGAEINKECSWPQPVLSIAVERQMAPLVKLLFDRGADPLAGLELQKGLSPVEHLVKIFSEPEAPGTPGTDLTYLDHLKASLALMAARGYEGEDFLRWMPELTSFPPNKIRHLPSMHRDEFAGCGRGSWAPFFLARELRGQYWRTQYPVL